MTAISSVGVVGSGTMGRGIAESALRAGLRVVLHDSSQEALSSARKRIESSLARSVEQGQLSADQASERLALLEPASAPDSLSGCQLVIEAVPEILEVKLAVLASVEGHVSRSAVIATNTSSIPITRLAQALAHRDRFLGLHFFNPVPRMPLVEVIRTVHSSEGTVAATREFVAAGLGKTALLLEDRPGFVVNALLIPFLLAAARMLDNGYAPAETIDEAMRLGCGHPMGPLELADFIGLDVVCAAADAMFGQSHDPALVVPNNLRRLVDAGHLGAKTGRGIYPHG
ncbi:3-hydroxybutyryl-CoA dehydrogenase [Zafaria cholistanensis]|uniref:3-hydroxybutyryl-CoA dehydrogenase n=1 Tax=Zafaria cholistanensis TaxID=1682741 RepID=A0A5A7NMV8_9MICC|nr:3-hydroxyacyl-CoA dehydrogenase family protein [Zafaria cholistanensis]GER22274.1 3-hydroxybutyryl-CoA dehydrogenase [Zafaria cholistanensis]